MSVLSYNGVILPYTNTEKYEMEAIADPSNTNWMLLRFRISVQCLLTPDYIALLAPDLASNTSINGPASILAVVRSRLMQRRGIGAPGENLNTAPLSFKVNGVETIPQRQTSLAGIAGVGSQPVIGYADSANGPIPEKCAIQGLGAGCFLLSYTISASYWESLSNNYANNSTPSVNLIGNPVLSNRWTESVSMDNENRSTISRDGRFIIRSDNASGLSADWFRGQMAVLALRSNFLRTSRSYQISEDGLTLSYKITDTEQWRMPIPPSYTSEGSISFSAGRGGANIQYEIDVTVTGDNNTSQADLGRAAVGFALDKLFNVHQIGVSPLISKGGITILGITFGGHPPVLLGVRLTFDLFKNRVKYRLSVLTNRPPSDEIDSTGNKTGVAFNYQGMASDPQGKFGGVPDTWANQTPGPPASAGGLFFPGSAQTAYPLRGTANLLLHAAGYWDPAIATMTVNSNGFVVNSAGTVGPPIPGEAGVSPSGKSHGPGPDN